jgi:hypothetical protein
VVVVSESFGAEFSRLHGSRKDWTPNFDRYAQQGLWFAHTYASGTRTVRGLEAVTASFPPIPTVSILQRPGNAGIATWGGVMRGLGYHTSFLYGGYGYFVLHARADRERIALFSHNHDVAILRGDRMVVLGLGKTSESLRYDAATRSFTTVADDPALRGLGIAYFQTAAELFDSHLYE